MQYRQFLLEQLSDAGKLRHYPPRAIIETSGAPGEAVYLLTHGRIRQYMIDSDGNEKTLLILGRGDLFGEVTGLRQDRNQVCTQALSQVSVRQLPARTFLLSLQRDSLLSFAVNELLSYKIRILMAQLQDSSFYNVEQRLKNLLLRLAMQQGVAVPCGIRIPQKYTHEELASMISSTRSTVSKMLKKLCDDDFLVIQNRYFLLKSGGKPAAEASKKGAVQKESAQKAKRK